MQSLTPRQKQLLAALSLLVGLSRCWALSATVWEADEARFAIAVRSFDVTRHHPHPPGFPLFIAAGKLAHALAGDEFRALQWVNLVCAMGLFPAVFFLAYQLGFSFATAAGGALITAFAPNVWFFGGTAFSDVSSLTLVLIACALLLASRERGPEFRTSNSLLTGAAILGLAAAFRPQNLLIGLVPLALAIWRKRWAGLIGAILTMILVLAGSYLGAMMASESPRGYLRAFTEHQDYIGRVDSFRSVSRPPLEQLFDDFFLKPLGSRRLGILILILVGISLAEAAILRRSPPWSLAVSFVPFALSAWLFLDYVSASRFSIGYLPMLGILAADGVGSLARRLPQPQREGMVTVGSVLVTVALAVWTAPAIRDARSAFSPPAAAAAWIHDHLPPRDSRLYVTAPMMPIAQYMLSEYSMIRVADERGVPLSSSETDSYILAEGATTERDGMNFLRPRSSRLWRITRPRFFEVSIIPLARRPQFLDGWYEVDNEGARVWRWMGPRSVTLLAPQQPPASLRIRLQRPLGAPVPNIRIHFNGRLLQEFPGRDKFISRDFLIPDSHADSPNQLVIETSQWINPRVRGESQDDRQLGLALHELVWENAAGASSAP